MVNWHEALSEKQKIAAREIAKAFKGQFPAEEVRRKVGIDEDELSRLIEMLKREHCIGVMELMDARLPIIIVHRPIFEVIHQLDNPPPKDYWRATEEWFRSRWWTVPVMVFVVLVSFAGGVVSLIKTALELFGQK